MYSYTQNWFNFPDYCQIRLSQKPKLSQGIVFRLEPYSVVSVMKF